MAASDFASVATTRVFRLPVWFVAGVSCARTSVRKLATEIRNSDVKRSWHFFTREHYMAQQS